MRGFKLGILEGISESGKSRGEGRSREECGRVEKAKNIGKENKGMRKRN